MTYKDLRNILYYRVENSVGERVRLPTVSDTRRQVKISGRFIGEHVEAPVHDRVWGQLSLQARRGVGMQ